MDWHVVSSKSLEMESTGHLEECKNPKPSFCYRASSAAYYVQSHSIIYVLPNCVNVSTEKQTRQEPMLICRRKNRRWYCTAKTQTDVGTVLLRTKNQTTIVPIRLRSTDQLIERAPNI